MNIYGLIGYPLTHSYSSHYFEEKFLHEKIENTCYKLFPIEKIESVFHIIKNNDGLKGFNVTIPHKQTILPLLNKITEPAKTIGAVNTVKIERNNDDSYKLIGYNTDAIGFEKSFIPIHQKYGFTKAIVIGTGGSARAIAYILKKYQIDFIFLSRNPKAKNEISNEKINKKIVAESLLIINCTPIGMFPFINQLPLFNYSLISKKHFLYDLVYNPAETQFMKEGGKKGAQIKNGMEMLLYQADESWKIWTTKT